MNYHIRPMRKEDAGDVARLSDELGYPSDAQGIAERFGHLSDNPNYCVYVVEHEPGALLGWIGIERRMLLESGEKFEIVGLVVDTKQRGIGIGKALVAVAEEWVAASGGSVVVVRSNVVRQESHPFYQGLGYDLWKTQHAYRKKLPVE